MAGAVCPACGVAVVPGYVRCPKCHRPLPRFGRATASPVGGTAIQHKSSPLGMIAIGIVVVGALVALFAIRGGKKSHAAPATPPPLDTTPATAPASAPPPSAPVAALPPVSTTTQNPGAIAAQLDRTLQRMRLFSTVNVTGARVEVLSASCRDPQLVKQVSAVAASFKAAGLTRVRCVEQSGAVVFDRDL